MDTHTKTKFNASNEKDKTDYYSCIINTAVY